MRDTAEGTDAVEAYQGFLDKLSDAVMCGDLDAVRRLSRLPYRVRSLTGTFVVDTDEKLAENFLRFSSGIREKGVTHYIRIAKTAAYVAPKRIEGIHTTYFYRNGEEVLAPYENRMILVREYGLWRVAAADHAMLNDRWPFDLPIAGEGLPDGSIETLPEAGVGD